MFVGWQRNCFYLCFHKNSSKKRTIKGYTLHFMAFAESIENVEESRESIFFAHFLCHYFELSVKWWMSFAFLSFWWTFLFLFWKKLKTIRLFSCLISERKSFPIRKRIIHFNLSNLNVFEKDSNGIAEYLTNSGYYVSGKLGRLTVIKSFSYSNCFDDIFTTINYSKNKYFYLFFSHMFYFSCLLRFFL